MNDPSPGLQPGDATSKEVQSPGRYFPAPAPNGPEHLGRLRPSELKPSRWRDLIGLAWIVLVALLYLSPAVKDGGSFGPSDLAANSSYLTLPGKSAAPVHDVGNSDIIDQGIAWNTLDWRLVHAGQWPLWNDLSGNGLPQFLNFQSAAFALPTLIGYLFPLSIAFLVTMAVKLLIAGTGAYLLTRLLGGRPTAAALSGTTFMLSGSLAGWLGWAVSGPLVWAGWIAAAAILVYRARTGRRAAAIGLLSLCVAFSIYGGFPETYVLLGAGLLCMLAVTGMATLAVRRRVNLPGLGRLGGSLAGGLALSAPLWLPGLSVIRHSVRSGTNAASGLPFHEALLLFAQGYDGLPIASSRAPSGSYFGSADYFETAAYVGIVALVFAGVALFRTGRRPAVAGLAGMAVFTLLIVYNLGGGAPVQHFVSFLGLQGLAVQRMLPILGLAIATLAGLGLEVVLFRWREGKAQMALIASAALVGAVVAVMWYLAEAPKLITQGAKLPPLSAPVVRRYALWWPTVEGLVLLTLALSLPLLSRLIRRPKVRSAATHRAPALACLGLAVVLAQSAFLVDAGSGINSYASHAYPETHAVKELQRIVGHHLVGIDVGPDTCTGSPPSQPCGVRSWAGIGLFPDINVAYGIDEMAVHDPLVPKAYFDSWPIPNSGQNGPGPNVFVPSIDTTDLARRYGVQYVLIKPSLPVPPGMEPVSTIETRSGVPLELVRVPGSPQFSFPLSGSGGSQQASVISVSHPENTTYRLQVHVEVPQRITIRITDVPGWQATVDGHPLPLERANGSLLSALVPKGATELVLTYRPALLELGCLCAIAAFAFLTGATAIGGLVHRRRRRRLTRPAIDT